MISKQNIDKTQLSIFIRDLSENINFNLKHLIEDYFINNKINDKNNKNHKNNKKIIIKKKDIIIQEQIKKKKKFQIDEDNKKIDYYLKNLNETSPFINLKNLQTDEGIIRFKFKLLNHFIKHKKRDQYIQFIFLLYFELKDYDYINEDEKKLIMKIQKTLLKYDYKLFMMEKMSYLLPPLNNFKKFNKFDQWQIDTINLIKNKESVIVRAPTSSGKSFIAMSTGIFHKKILYICPAKPVAYQVGSHFINMGYKVHFLVENISHYSYDKDTNIFIGTPYEIENEFYKIKNDFDYVVFDEIHNLNKEDDGNIYENLIKLIDCNFLALSATIKNIEFLKEIFQKNFKDHKINYIEYNKKFINHQKWYWNNSELIKLHPMCAFQKINDHFLKNDLSFTPNDCADLWNKIEDEFDDLEDEIDGLSPDEYFNEERLLTLDDCSKYEYILKNKLFELNKNYPNKIQNIFTTYYSKNNRKIKKNQDDIILFLKKCKKNDMFPMIMFHTNENSCKNLFIQIFDYLDKKELEEYPYHYKILEKKNDIYQRYLDKREEYISSIKIKTKNSQFELNDKIKNFEMKEKNNFINLIIEFYHKKIKFLENNNDNHDHLIQNQIQNLKDELNEFIKNPDFIKQDIFKKHKDFVFTNTPMSENIIRNIRREIYKTLNIRIPYESILFQMLKRGIGIYSENMPEEYNWILQKLLSKRLISIIISDKTLCLGIDLPIRTTCFLGIDNVQFTKDEYIQMSGRAGRRGLDNRGNIIFYDNINYLELMDGNLPDIIGNPKPIYSNYKILEILNTSIKSEKLFHNFIHKDRKLIKIQYNQHKVEFNKKLFWYLRNYKNSSIFIENLFEIEKDLYGKDIHNKNLILLNEIFNFTSFNNKDILKIYNNKKIENFNIINEIKLLINILINIHNNIHFQKYKDIYNTSKILFHIFNITLFNYSIHFTN